MTFEISKLVNGLVDPLVSKRFEALQNTQAWLLSCFRLEPQGFPHVVEDVVAKPLLRRFADQSEKCRCLSIRIFSEYVHSVCILLPFTQCPFLHLFIFSILTCFFVVFSSISMRFTCFFPPFLHSVFFHHFLHTLVSQTIYLHALFITYHLLLLTFELHLQTSVLLSFPYIFCTIFIPFTICIICTLLAFIIIAIHSCTICTCIFCAVFTSFLLDLVII